VDRQKFGYGFWATYAEQEKNFLRRNADINIKDREALQGLAKKNIKIIFLILKQFLASSSPASSTYTYKEVLASLENIVPSHVANKLAGYESIRAHDTLSAMSAAQLRKIISVSVELFNDLGKLMITHARNI